MKTPEKQYFFEKRSNSQTIKNEKKENHIENFDEVNLYDEKSSLENLNSNNFICETHQEEMNLFCIPDKETLCPSCIYFFGHHKNHKILPLKFAFDIIKNDNERFRRISKEKIQKIDDSIKVSMKNITLVNNNIASLMSDIEKEFEYLRKVLDEKEKDLIDTLNKICQTKIQTYEHKIQDLTFLRNCLRDYISFDMSTEFDQNTFVYIYNVNSLLKKTLSNIDLNFKLLNANDLEKIDITNKKKLLNEITAFSNIYTKKDNYLSKSLTEKRVYGNKSVRTDFSSFDERNFEAESFLENNEKKQAPIFINNSNNKEGFHKRSKTDYIGTKILENN